MNIKIPIPQKVSTNAVYAGMHWSKRKDLADLYHRCLVEHRDLRVKEYPVDVFYTFTFKGKMLDPSNTSFMQKMLEDGMVKLGILAGDTAKYISGIHIFVEKGVRDEVEIML